MIYIIFNICIIDDTVLYYIEGIVDILSEYLKILKIYLRERAKMLPSLSYSGELCCSISNLGHLYLGKL